MKLGRIARFGLVPALTLAAGNLSSPQLASAQECQGQRPGGGMWASSGELYIDRAQKNPNPQDKRDLYQQAVDVLTEGFSEQPGNPRNYLLAGEAYVGMDDYASADSVWTIAEEMWSCYSARLDTLRFNAWARAFNRGVQYSQSGDAEQAIEAYEKAYAIYKEQPQPLLQIGNYHAQQAQMAESDSARSAHQDRAIEAFQGALEAIGESERLSDENRTEYGRAATFNLAQLLALQDRHREAAQAYEDFLEDEPDNITAKSNLAVVLTLAADGAEDESVADSLRGVAMDYYEELLAVEDLTAEQYHNIGTGLQRLDATELAIQAFRQALDLEPYRANSQEQLAISLFSLERYDTLATMAETLVERYPANMNNLAMLANAYRELERREDALAILEQREALPFELLSLELIETDAAYSIAGHLNNRTLEPGTPIRVEFELRDETGEVAGTATLEMQAGEQDVPEPFNVEVLTEAVIAGFTYRVVEPQLTADGG